MYSTVNINSCKLKFLSKNEQVTPKKPNLLQPVHISIVKFTEIELLFKNSCTNEKVVL